LLHADYCAEYEHTFKINLNKGKKFFPLYTVNINLKIKYKEGIPMPMRKAVCRTYYHQRF